MGNLNYIVFGGVDSRDYGIYISGEGVFNAPERDVEVVNIPGKDGDLLIDRGRFLNIQVTYPGFNFEPDLSTFAERLRAFRAALASQTGYQRLEDSFHPDEFRLASFRSGLDVNPIMYNTASTFDIVFDCKPQRFLKSGEEEITIGEWGETETVTGDIATFEGTDTTAIKSVVAEIEPKQEGSGDPSPDNIRPISGRDGMKVWDDPKYGGAVVWNQLARDMLDTNWFAENGGTRVITDGVATLTAGSLRYSFLNMTALNSPMPAGHKLLMSFECNPSKNAAVYMYFNNFNWQDGVGKNNCEANTWTRKSGIINTVKNSGSHNERFVLQNATADFSGMSIQFKNAVAFDLTQMFGETKADEIYAMETAHAGDGVAYFKNLFYKDYYPYNTGELTCVSAVNGDPYESYSIPFKDSQGNPIAVYGGEIDVVSGKLKSYSFYPSYNGETLSGEWICDRAVYSQGTTPPIGSQVVDMSGNGTEYQLEPTEIKTLKGNNNVWCNTGDVSVEIGEDPNILVNPTPFEALPLIEAVGVGSLTVGNTTIGITGDSTQDIFIDSDIMEAYEDDNGAIISRNDRINLSGTDFPKLGEETRVESNGLTSVKITPRWWTI